MTFINFNILATPYGKAASAPRADQLFTMAMVGDEAGLKPSDVSCGINSKPDLSDPIQGGGPEFDPNRLFTMAMVGDEAGITPERISIGSSPNPSRDVNGPIGSVTEFDPNQMITTALVGDEAGLDPSVLGTIIHPDLSGPISGAQSEFDPNSLIRLLLENILR